MKNKNKKWDFSGYATSFNKLCSDGRTILDGCFKEDDKAVVPLVFQHNHKDIDNVIGHCLLEYRPGKGVYTYGLFNDTAMGKTAKEQVRHGDLTALSIYANNLVQDSSRNVSHGKIREVSLVLAGANPGAFIDNVCLAHADGSIPEDEMVYYSGRHITSYLSHSETKSIKEVYSGLNEEQKACVKEMIRQAIELDRKDRNLSHADGDGEDGDDYDEEDYEEEDYDEDDEDESEDDEEDDEDEDEDDEEDDGKSDEFDLDSPEDCAEAVELIENFSEDQLDCAYGLIDVMINGADHLSEEESMKILEEFDNMDADQQWAIKVLAAQVMADMD